MNQLFGYTAGSIVLLYFVALTVLSIVISIKGKGIWEIKEKTDKDKERREQ